MAYNGSVTISGASGALVGVSDNAYASANLSMFQSLMSQYASSGFNTLTTSTNLLVANSSGNVGVIDGGASSVILVGDSSTLSYIGGSGNATLVTGTGDAYILAGSGNDTIALGSGTDQVYLGSGASQVSVAGADNFIQAGSGADTITLTGVGATVDGGYSPTGFAPLLVDDTGGTDDTINVVNGTTVDASTISTTTVNAYGDTTVDGAAGSNTTYNQNNGTLLFVGTGGSVSITGDPAAGNDTLYGSNGSVITLNSPAHNNIFVGNDTTQGDGGSELFDGSMANGGNQFWAGSGNTTLLGGTGGDTMVGGIGNTTMVGGINGSATNYFDLFAAGTGSATNLTIENFEAVPTNQLTLFNFGASAAATAIAGATTGNGGTVLHLANSATITLVGVNASYLNTTNVVSTT